MLKSVTENINDTCIQKAYLTGNYFFLLKHNATDFLEKCETLNGSVLEVQVLDYEPEILF